MTRISCNFGVQSLFFDYGWVAFYLKFVNRGLCRRRYGTFGAPCTVRPTFRLDIGGWGEITIIKMIITCSSCSRTYTHKVVVVRIDGPRDLEVLANEICPIEWSKHVEGRPCVECVSRSERHERTRVYGMTWKTKRINTKKQFRSALKTNGHLHTEKIYYVSELFTHTHQTHTRLARNRKARRYSA